MRRVTRLAAAAFGAAGVGAGLAVARHRSRAAPPETPRAAPTTSAAPNAATAPPDDPQAALDAARERLRERADELRRDIESSGEPGGA